MSPMLDATGHLPGPTGLLQVTDSAWYQNLVDAGSEFLPALLAALGILIVGYVIALVVASVTRRALSRTGIDDRLMDRLGRSGEEGESERAVGKAVFWTIMIFVFLGAFQVLGLTLIGEPLNIFLNEVFAFAPNLLGAAVLGLVAWGVATILKRGSLAAMEATGFDERIGGAAASDEVEPTPGEPRETVPLSKSLSTGLYWLVILLFIPAILGALQLQSLVQPVNVMLDEFMAFVPNLVGAAAILVVGWFVARVVRNATTNVLRAAGTDELGERYGVQDAMGEQTPSGLVGLFLFVLILIPVVVGALDALGIEAVTAPAQNALDDIVGVIPDLAAAAGIVLIAYLVARVVAGAVTGLMAGVGADRLWSKVGVEEPAQAPRVSRATGLVAGGAILALASIEAAAVLGFDLVAGVFTDLLVFAGQIALGLVILVAGLWLGRVAGDAVRATTMRNARTLGLITQAAIVIFAGGIALQEIGLANELVLLTFGLVLGAAAVAGAIAFGLGGREVAEEELRTWRNQARGERPPTAPQRGEPAARAAGGED